MLISEHAGELWKAGGGGTLQGFETLKNESEVQEIALRGEAGSRRHALILASLVCSSAGAESVPGHDSNVLQPSWKSHVTAAADLSD